MDYVAIITAILGAALGYLVKLSNARMEHERATQINERDLLLRIDDMQAQIVALTRENASLKSEIAGLRADLRTYRCRMHPESETLPAFAGQDYAEGDV